MTTLQRPFKADTGEKIKSTTNTSTKNQKAMTTVYYPLIKSINFYDANGVVCGGMTGSLARGKFDRLVKSGTLPRISLRRKVKVQL